MREKAMEERERQRARERERDDLFYTTKECVNHTLLY